MFNSIKSMSLKPGFWLLVVLWTSLLSGCGSKPPERNFDDVDLLINKSVMPQGWEVAESAKQLYKTEGEDSKAYIIFYLTATSYAARGGETVYRYSDSGKAAWHYSRFARDYFNDISVYRTTSWQTPANFAFSSAFADQWRFACAGSNFSTGPQDGSNSILCGYLAQYDEFLVFFSITTEIDDHTFITLDELSPVIKALDQSCSLAKNGKNLSMGRLLSRLAGKPVHWFQQEGIPCSPRFYTIQPIYARSSINSNSH